MNVLPDIFYDLNIFSIVLRLVLALLFGGLIGLERGAERHPAGFRTHILVCVGAALAMITNQYMVDIWPSQVDPSRIGAQVITGVGFLGAGTIILTGRNKIRGLTTAAGCWVAAIVGLALGAGYYEGGLLATVLVIATELVFIRIEYWFVSHDTEISLYAEYMKGESLEKVLDLLAQKKIRVHDLEISQIEESNTSCAIIHFRMRNKVELYALTEELYNIRGIISLEEL